MTTAPYDTGRERSEVARYRTKRDLIGLIYPRRLSLFDKLNANAQFVRIRRAFQAAPVAGDRTALHSLVSERVGQSSIDYFEFGVWEGASLALWTRLNQHPDSQFFGFDTFKGLPEDWGRIPKGTFSVLGARPQLADPRVQLVVGLFQQSLYPFLSSYRRQGRLIIHIDCDLYTSTLYCLAAMDRLLEPGDILIFDDFYSLDHEFDAYLDYSRSFYRRFTPLASSPHCTQVAMIADDVEPGPGGTGIGS